MSVSHRVLILDQKAGHRESLLSAAQGIDQYAATQVVSTISEAVRSLGTTGYDAVLLQVDRADELTLLLRIKASAPGTPVVAVMREDDPKLKELARVSGADVVLSEIESPSPPIDLGDQTRQLIRQSRVVSQSSHLLRDRMRELLHQGRSLRRSFIDPAQVPANDLVPLLIDDDSDQAFLMERCFRNLKYPFPLPVQHDGDEAVKYLSGSGRKPTLVLLDLHLPRRSGFEVLQWMKSQPSCADLITFVLSTSPMKEDMHRALALGADYYYVKPLTLGALEDMVQAMAMRWAIIFQGQAGRNVK